MNTSHKKLIKIAHSPDSDDAFMFYALKMGKVTSPRYNFEIERIDIEELNQLAQNQIYDITAISIHAYAHLADKYALTASGASMAENNYGPLVIAKNRYQESDLKDLTIAVPGEATTAFLVLKIIEPNFKHIVVRFDQIMDAVQEGKADAGLIIHEGQLQYEKLGFHKVLSLIDAWKKMFGTLPLPLGGNAVKKSLGSNVMHDLAKIQKESILYAMNHKDEAREYAQQFKRDLSVSEANQYLNWYANNRTLDMGSDGKDAIDKLLKKAFEKNLIPHKINIEIIE